MSSSSLSAFFAISSLSASLKSSAFFLALFLSSSSIAAMIASRSRTLATNALSNDFSSEISASRRAAWTAMNSSALARSTRPLITCWTAASLSSASCCAQSSFILSASLSSTALSALILSAFIWSWRSKVSFCPEFRSSLIAFSRSSRSRCLSRSRSISSCSRKSLRLLDDSSAFFFASFFSRLASFSAFFSRSFRETKLSFGPFALSAFLFAIMSSRDGTGAAPILLRLAPLSGPSLLRFSSS
mmetsp:Transcript_27507/g.81962  ORF Transcript_27507/g.81962 Transcript_27507/m.81962 type:complete len:244 (+) Transcript_27507:627-1358(+)